MMLHLLIFSIEMYQTNIVEISAALDYKSFIYKFLHYHMIMTSQTKINSLHSQRKFSICCISHMR